jgi:hypothetical protein
MVSKNRDYRGAGDDPFANFRGSEFLGVDPILGILMRCMDKFQRIRSFANTGTLAVKSESFEDAVVDVINYMVLAAGMAQERTRPNETANMAYEMGVQIGIPGLFDIQEEARKIRDEIADDVPIAAPDEPLDANIAYLKSLPESQIPEEPPAT